MSGIKIGVKKHCRRKKTVAAHKIIKKKDGTFLRQKRLTYKVPGKARKGAFV
jgi:hypothetical protein